MKTREKGKITLAAWEGNTFCTYQVNTIGINGFSPTEVLLDNQTDVSVMKPERMVKPAEKPIRVNGVGGVQLLADQTGYLQDFFRVYASRDIRANVLCFADVEYLNSVVMYDQGQGFTVNLPERET
jgi:hypothetical protein